MKIVLLLILLPTLCFSQKPAVLLTVPGEQGVIDYRIQSSRDQKKWKDIQIITPVRNNDTNMYSIDIPAFNVYYRAKAYMVGGKTYISPVVFSVTSLPVELTNIFLINKTLTWTSNNETDVDYYGIEEARADGKWEETMRAQPRGNSTYKVLIK